MILRAGVAFFALAAASPAFAQCSMPPELVARICNDPALAKLDAQLVEKEKAVQAITHRPTTWAARARSFRANIAVEKDFDGKLIDAATLASHITDRMAALDGELQRAAAILPATGEAAILGEICLSKWLVLDCKVPAAGILRGADGTRILYQLLAGSSEEDGIGMGVMLWDVTRAGAPRPIGSMFEGVVMENPRFDSERQLLWVTGRTTGTADGNADILYQKQAGKWVEIDLESWQNDLARRLPEGVGAWHGVDYDLTGLFAETELWKDNDANCCATGGRATLDFEIVGNTLTLKAISAQIGGPDTAWKDF
ncbi:MAG: hypothetical protein EOP62_03600 [Sphingomonadales bacterium]|nr:MAG: hypothetical protein EOP62_03600 [Sphingomonadales bacterium]